MNTVPNTTDIDEAAEGPDEPEVTARSTPGTGWYAKAAEALHSIADDLAALDVPGDPWVSLNFQPADEKAANDAKVAAIDTVAQKLLGRPAETRRMTGGVYHHTISGARGPVQVAIYGGVANPAERDLRAENERLRAELARAQAVTATPNGSYDRDNYEPGPEQPIPDTVGGHHAGATGWRHT